MWILDQGIFESKEAEEHSMKIVIWDLKKDELKKIFYFADGVVSSTNSFLNDIVVDSKKHLAFISDSGIPVYKNGTFKPALIVYDEEHDKTKRFFKTHKSMQPVSDFWLTVNGKKCFKDQPMQTGVDGIALSCDMKRLYWTPLTSREMYAIEVDYLLMYSDSSDNVDKHIVSLGNKGVASDGLACSDNHECFISDIENNSVYSFDEHDVGLLIEGKRHYNFNLNATMEKVTNASIVWPDTFAFGNDALYVVSNNLCEWIQGNLDWNVDNIIIYKLDIQGEAYTKGCRPDFYVDRTTMIVGGVFIGLYVVSMFFVLVTRNITCETCRRKKKTIE